MPAFPGAVIELPFLAMSEVQGAIVATFERRNGAMSTLSISGRKEFCRVRV
jgi:hypothetical protein